jgi:acetyl-CoA/propionyl-CoA carboxylase biotin carboxyl carrier protein
MAEIAVRLDGVAVPCELARDGDAWIVRVGSRTHRLRMTILGPGEALVESEGRTHLLHAATVGGRTSVHVDGVTLEVAIVGGERASHRPEHEGELRAPMPGVVTQVMVQAGDTVRPGQPLLIVEAMKMEHVVRAGAAGIVQAIRVRAGDQVEGGAVVAELASAAGVDAS